MGFSFAKARALAAKLAAGTSSAGVAVYGDSTGNNSDEWFPVAMLWLAAQYPAYSLTHAAWNDTLQAWDASNAPGGVAYVLQTGTAGDAYIAGTWASGQLISTPDVAALRITGDLDVRAKIMPSSWSIPGGSNYTITSKFGNAGNRGWRFHIGSAGSRLVFEGSQDGTALVSATCSANLNSRFSDGTAGWVRMTYTAATSKVDFYTSTDGITWNGLGTQQTLTGITALFPCTQAAEIGIRTAGSDPFVGRIYYVEWRAGIDTAGVPKLLCDLDSAIGSTAQTQGSGGTFTDSLGRTWTRAGAALTFSGAPGLLLFNGSTPGKTIAYSNDGTRGPIQRTIYPPDLTFISYSHNEGALTAYTSPYQTLAAACSAAFPSTGIVAVVQNQKTAPETAGNISAHATRGQQIRALVGPNPWGFVDAEAAFDNSPLAMSLLVDPADGIHPLAAGKTLWATETEALFSAQPPTLTFSGARRNDGTVTAARR